MRILLVTGIYPPDIGGPATHAAILQEELTGRGHRITVVTLTDGERSHEPGVVRYPRKWKWPVRAAAIVLRLIRRRRDYDVVYALGLHPVAVLGARLAGRPVLSRVVADAAWERSSRMGLTEAGFESFQAGGGGGPRVWAMRKVRDRSARWATGLVVPSERMVPYVRSWGADPDRITVVPNSARAPRDVSPRRPDGTLRVVFSGRLIPLKRVDVVIEALAFAPDVFLEIVGDGPDRANLERLTHRAGVADRVSFTGALAHEDAHRRIAASDVLVIPSSYDTSPNVVVEALVCGVPIVGSAAGGLPEMIIDGRSGYLVDPVTPSHLAEVMLKLQLDPDLRTRLAEGASEEGAERRIEHAADLIEHALVRSLGKPRAVFVGRSPIDIPLKEATAKRFGILARHLDAVVLAVGPPTSRRVAGVRVILFPRTKPRVVGSALHYLMTPPIALTLARRRGSVLICQSPHTAFGPLVLTRLLPKRIRPRVLVEVHGNWEASTRLYGGGTRRSMAPLADACARWAIRRADRVRTVGSQTTALARAAGYEGEIETFLTFSDIQTFSEIPRVDVPPTRTVLYAGAFEEVKGVDVLIDAWAGVLDAHPDAILELAGEGSLRDRLEARARRLDGRVRFHGHVSASDLIGLLDRATCLVLPSLSEGTPRIIVEAMARGRAVVASDVGAIGDLVENDRSGVLVPAGDADALAGGLARVLGDVEGAARMGAEAARRFDQSDLGSEFEAGIVRTAVWISRHD